MTTKERHKSYVSKRWRPIRENCEREKYKEAEERHKRDMSKKKRKQMRRKRK